jgi:hypothetical protein
MELDMKDRFALLFPHERTALLNALRRDLRSETEKSMTNGPLRDAHAINAQHTLRLLEALNPKKSRSSSSPSPAAASQRSGRHLREARDPWRHT